MNVDCVTSLITKTSFTNRRRFCLDFPETIAEERSCTSSSPSLDVHCMSRLLDNRWQHVQLCSAPNATHSLSTNSLTMRRFGLLSKCKLCVRILKFFSFSFFFFLKMFAKIVLKENLEKLSGRSTTFVDVLKH